MPNQSIALIAVLATTLVLTGCSRKPTEEELAYRAACEGPPLGNVERRQKAMEDGVYLRRYDCVGKAALRADKEQKERYAAANTPEALAAREAEREKMIAEEKAARERAEAARVPDPPPAPFVLRSVEVNTASESDIAYVVSGGADVAAQIVAERGKRPFTDWADLVNRVSGIHAAQTAYHASVSGLKVNGEPLLGAPPDAMVAGALRRRQQR